MLLNRVQPQIQSNQCGILERYLHVLVIVRAMIMNAHVARGNRWIGLLDGGRLRRVQYVAAGKLPVLDTLRRRVKEFIGARVFDIALVNDDAHVLRC